MEFVLGLPERRYGKRFPFAYRGTGKGTGRRETIWLTGRDGSPRFLGGTGSWNGSGTGWIIGREHSREIGRENRRASVGNILGKTVGKNSREIVREQRSRDMAGRYFPEWLGTRSGTNAGWRQRFKRGK